MRARGLATTGVASVDTTRLARLALDCIEREYPNKVAHVMASDADAGTPRAMTPAFFGCFDWHSAVLGHWLLVRLLRSNGDAPWAADARAAIGRNLTATNLAGELAYISRADRVGFERPYGLAWLLQLGVELHQWQEPAAAAMVAAIAPLEQLAATRLAQWAEKLTHPVRSGEHSQSAFAFGLAIDWARETDAKEIEAVLVRRSIAMHERDQDCNLALEPSGQDFLSPCLGAADLMRRVMAPAAFATWMDRALPQLASKGALVPAVPTDRSDGKLVHLDGLNLSRAWMLEGIAAGLPATDERRAAILEAAHAHAEAGLAAVDDAHYEGGHWLGTFAAYLVTRRGIPPQN
jgi:hypothetical protein